jgi:hypothetical protein
MIGILKDQEAGAKAADLTESTALATQRFTSGRRSTAKYSEVQRRGSIGGKAS